MYIKNTLPLHNISGQSCDVIWHGRGFEQSLYSKAGIYGVNKLPGMVTLTTKVKKKVSLDPENFFQLEVVKSMKFSVYMLNEWKEYSVCRFNYQR